MQQPTDSTLQWPYQIPPLEANWRLWTRVIRSLYTRPNSNILTHKLGPWHHDNVFRNWSWTWRIDPVTHALYQRVGRRWQVYLPTLSRRTYITYNRADPQPSTPPQPHFPPATPTPDGTSNCILVALPICPLTIPWDIPTAATDDLLARLCTAPVAWAETLWH